VAEVAVRSVGGTCFVGGDDLEKRLSGSRSQHIFPGLEKW
jgi:hypothetical protein